jgi:hypothetical protein
VGHFRADVNALIELAIPQPLGEEADADVISFSHEIERPPDDGVVESKRAFDVVGD